MSIKNRMRKVIISMITSLFIYKILLINIHQNNIKTRNHANSSNNICQVVSNLKILSNGLKINCIVYPNINKKNRIKRVLSNRQLHHRKLFSLKKYCICLIQEILIKKIYKLIYLNKNKKLTINNILVYHLFNLLIL
jgi:hypothetical protein